MDLLKGRLLSRFKWQIIIIYAAVIVLILLTFFTDIFSTTQADAIPQLTWLLGGLVLLITLIVILSKAIKIIGLLETNRSEIDKISESLEKNHSLLAQIEQSVNLSESVRQIVFSDDNRRSLQELVLDKLQQKDFDGTYKIIDEIGQAPKYQALAEQLRKQADGYRDATDQERVNQVIEHIEKLFDNYQWTKAGSLIERLIKAEPNSEKAKAMRQKLLDKKEERKKVLLTAWDDAVKRQATNRSLEILKELDLYLTPNEGLALQEAARDVFRNKLHNLGVRFSLAVSGKNWSRALETGQEIIRDFPNSKMAGEIRERIAILRQRIEQ